MKGGGTRKEMVKWTPPMDDAFIQALLSQHYAGNRVEGTFTTTAYENMIRELKTTIGMDFTKQHLKNRIKTLKEHFNECYDIFKNRMLNGFSWNSTTKLWTAQPGIWEELIRANPHAEKWKTKPINHYESLELLFTKDRATGKGASTTKGKRKRGANEGNGLQSNGIEEIDQLMFQNETALEDFAATPTQINEQPLDIEAEVHKENGIRLGTKRKVSNDEEYEILKGALNNVAEAIREGNSIFEKSRPRVYSEEDIFNELRTIKVDNEVLDDCYLYLTENADKTRAFFGCPRERRKNILMKMMAISKHVERNYLP